MFLRILVVALLSAALGVSGSCGADAAVRGDRTVLGYVEDAFIGRLGLEMKAKLDTGADTSSIFARDVEIYKKSQRDNWVRFRLIGKNGRSVRYDQNVIRFAAIKLKTGGTIRRPVIHLPICVGGVAGLAEVNLADREDFEYDVLIGREFLAARIVVDSASTFAAEDECDAGRG
ncbi:MAG: RimK/LysX family protein [Pseudomonadota bacterium]